MMQPPGQPPNPYGQPPQGAPDPQQQYQQYPQQGYPQQQPQQQQYPQQQQQYPQQGYPQQPQQQQYPQQPQQQQYPQQQQQYPQQGYYPQQGMQPGAQPAGGKRNPALIGIGAFFLLISLAFGGLFMMNFYQYSTVEDRWAEKGDMIPEARAFGVRIVKASAMNKMTTFGPISAVTGLVGIVLVVLGARKK